MNVEMLELVAREVWRALGWKYRVLVVLAVASWISLVVLAVLR